MSYPPAGVVQHHHRRLPEVPRRCRWRAPLASGHAPSPAWMAWTSASSMSWRTRMHRTSSAATSRPRTASAVPTRLQSTTGRMGECSSRRSHCWYKYVFNYYFSHINIHTHVCVCAHVTDSRSVSNIQNHQSEWERSDHDWGLNSESTCSSPCWLALAKAFLP